MGKVMAALKLELRRTTRHDEGERHREGASFRLVSPAARPLVDADEPALHPTIASMLHKLGHTGDDLDKNEKLLRSLGSAILLNAETSWRD